MNPQQQNRDERSYPIGRKPAVNDITERFSPRADGSRQVDREAAQHRGSAVREPREEVEALPPVLRRVLKDKANVNFAMPGGSLSFRGTLRAGKVVSSHHYDLEDLKAQGVLLGAVEDEIAGVPAQGGGSAQVQLRDMLAALREMGLEVVPRAAAEASSPPTSSPADIAEIERLKSELAELKKKAK
jgi:hypothetical protein